MTGPWVGIAAFFDGEEHDEKGNPLLPKLIESVTTALPAFIGLRLFLVLHDFPDETGATVPLELEIIAPSGQSVGVRSIALNLRQPWNSVKYYVRQQFPVEEPGVFHITVSYQGRLLTRIPLLVALPGGDSDSPQA